MCRRDTPIHIVILGVTLLLIGDVIGSHDRSPIVKRNEPEPETQFPNNQRRLACNLTFDPSEITIQESQSVSVNFTLTCFLHYFPGKDSTGISFQFWIADASIAVIDGNSSFPCEQDPGHDTSTAAADLDTVTSYLGQLRVRGVSFGKTLIEVRTVRTIAEEDIIAREPVAKYRLSVIKVESLANIIFLVILGIMIVIYNYGFGCKIEWALIVAIIKRPVTPAIGFCCQFLVMAPLSFGVAILLRMSNESGLGLLAIGAAPGGGGSNVFAYLLNGDLELSITMSFISTIASLGMTPLWIWALGRYFTTDDPEVRIPVSSVFSSLAVVTLPVLGGLLTRRLKPEAAGRMASGLKPLTAVIGAIFVGAGVYVYYPALVKVTWRTLVACLLVPLAGYGVGAGAGKVLGQSRARWLTIALETGFQNLALSLLIIGTSLDQPESDLAGVVPVCYTFLSASLAVVAYLGMVIHRIRNGDKPCHKKWQKQLADTAEFREDDRPEPTGKGSDLDDGDHVVLCTAVSNLPCDHVTSNEQNATSPAREEEEEQSVVVMA